MGIIEKEGRATVGPPCVWCDEPLGVDHVEMLVAIDPHLRSTYMHRECVMRAVYGSVAHQEERCPCFGGTGDDPVDLTKREAAAQAARVAWAKHLGGGEP